MTQMRGSLQNYYHVFVRTRLDLNPDRFPRKAPSLPPANHHKKIQWLNLKLLFNLDCTSDTIFKTDQISCQMPILDPVKIVEQSTIYS